MSKLIKFDSVVRVANGDVFTCNYESTPMTYNGKAGRLWVRWVNIDGGRAHDKKCFVRDGASETEIEVAFDDTLSGNPDAE